MMLMGAAVGGVILVGIIYLVYKLCRKHVFGIVEPGKNFVVDKKVKCKSGKYLVDEEEGFEERNVTPQY